MFDKYYGFICEKDSHMEIKQYDGSRGCIRISRTSSERESNNPTKNSQRQLIYD